MHKQLLSAFTKAPVLLVGLFIAFALPFVSLPEITRADMNNTRLDAFGTDELSGSSWLSGSGVDVYSNGSSALYNSGVYNCVTVSGGAGSLGCGSGTVPSGIEWQCVELFNRLYLSKGLITTRWAGNGNTLINNIPSGFSEQAYNAVTYIHPGDAITFDDGSAGHVAMVNSVSGSTVQLVSQNTQGVYFNVTWSGSTLTQTYLTGYNVQAVIHAPSVVSYPDGTYLRASDTGAVYVMAGGAPVPVYSWSNVGGQHPYTDTTQAAITAMPQYPRDGTYVRGYTTGAVYVMAGDGPVAVYSWSNVGGQHPYTNIDANAVTLRFRQYPADGTYVRAYTTGAVYTMAGGAPLPVTSWAAVGGQQPYTDIDVNALTLQFRSYPADDTYLEGYGYASIYLTAGDALFSVSSWTAVGGQHPFTIVDPNDLPNFRQYPVDGTYVESYGSANIYEVAGGSPLAVTSWAAVGGAQPYAVVPSGSLSLLLSYPQDGTYVRGYQSGEEFQAMTGAVTRITTTPLPAATVVDDWAIINQLGGTE